jgi:hypothetical protein
MMRSPQIGLQNRARLQKRLIGPRSTLCDDAGAGEGSGNGTPMRVMKKVLGHWKSPLFERQLYATCNCSHDANSANTSSATKKSDDSQRIEKIC